METQFTSIIGLWLITGKVSCWHHIHFPFKHGNTFHFEFSYTPWRRAGPSRAVSCVLWSHPPHLLCKALKCIFFFMIWNCGSCFVFLPLSLPSVGDVGNSQSSPNFMWNVSMCKRVHEPQKINLLGEGEKFCLFKKMNLANTHIL